MSSRQFSFLTLLMIGIMMPGFSTGQSSLPSLGDRISGTVSLTQEYQLGQQFLSQIRRSAPTIPDALLNTYLENVSFKLAARSQLQDRRLSFVIIDSQEINAFAAPGGIIGVNTGLFLNARTEAEFASVMGHELAHVSQRHFARGIDQAQAGRFGQLAGLLASVLIMATSDAGQGTAALSAVQGLAMDQQLRFSRSNETEADRIGQDTMYAAGFDPAAQASMYEQLLAQNRFGRRPPEFLLTHPLTESRIAASRGRASRYPTREYSPNLEYQIMRARIVAHYALDKEALVADIQQRLAASTSTFTREANSYALAVAYWENEQFAEAERTLAPLLEKYPNQISLVVTQAEIYTRQNEPRRAMDYLERHLEINPNNHPLTMAYVDALLEARSYNEAAEMMSAHTRYRENDHHLWYQLAETWGQAGNISQVHQARAEYFMLVGDFGNAREQLRFALRIESDNGASPAEEARLQQKIREVEQRQRELSG
ncbi:MAG: M48 family metalloprotease [Pseudomonadales bacterium]|nr:M48 family metalloprotease [Pseudomonadales bacterium]